MLGILACPEVGGDTVFANTAEAYKYVSLHDGVAQANSPSRLSQPFQSFVDGLKAVHSSKKLIEFARANGGLIRKNPVESIHPLIRVHPVTSERAIFLNSEFVTEIQGLKDQEATLVKDFLVNHIQTGHDFQARISWERYSVVMFDGRTTLRE